MASNDGWEDVPISSSDGWEDVPLSAPIPERPKHSRFESLVRGALQGATIGNADELSGGIEAIGSKLGGDKRGFMDLYRESRDRYRKLHEDTRKDNPVTYTGGEIGGSLLLPVGEAGGIVKAAKAGSAYGAGAGLGTSNADLTKGEFGQAAKDTAEGAVTGGVSGTVGGAGLKLLKKLPNAAEKFAEIRALKAAGFIGKDIKQIARQEPGRIQQIGRALLDEKVIPFGGNSESVLDRLTPRVTEIGERTGKALEALDSHGASLDLHDLTGTLHRDALREYAGKPALRDVLKSAQHEIGAVGELADEIGASTGDARIPLSQVERNLKMPLDERINWSHDSGRTDNAAMLKLLRRSISSASEDAAQTADPQAFQNWKTLKGRYGLLSAALPKGREALARDIGNRAIRPSDHLASAIGAVAGGPPGAAIAGLANHLLLERGSSASAVGADAFAKALRNSSAPSLAGREGQLTGALVQALRDYRSDQQ